MNDRMGFVFNTKNDKTNSNVFSSEAKIEGIPLMSKNNGRYKKVTTFKGKGYDEMSIADEVLELLNLDAFTVEN